MVKGVAQYIPNAHGRDLLVAAVAEGAPQAVSDQYVKVVTSAGGFAPETPMKLPTKVSGS